MLLQPGSYEVVVVSPDYDLNGRNDPDDFVVGKVRVRAKIEQEKRKQLVIREIPFGTTTGGVSPARRSQRALS